jgi:hypothetical protein
MAYATAPWHAPDAWLATGARSARKKGENWRETAGKRVGKHAATRYTKQDNKSEIEREREAEMGGKWAGEAERGRKKENWQWGDQEKKRKKHGMNKW